ncbi:hypothetical protein BEN30_16890 [Magnetovibrio blakemorei]|uniref:Sel1 repeat family protein n=2 Tax=Magnetovibrio blakemorei TaxID=28181 RepID=A0A1E5Q3J1_9PROT|nr:hypothetical protein BEN30_16890 [Magnetovibrio blakemorei]
MFRYVFFLFSFLYLWPTNTFATEQSQVSISALVEKAKTALAEQDEHTFDTTMGDLYERITGFTLPPSDSDAKFTLPEGVSEAEYIEKTCNYARLTEPIFTRELLDVIRHQTALLAYSVVLEGEEDEPYVRAMMECEDKDGRVLETSKFMREGIAWAKTFQAADTQQAMLMAKDIKALAKQNPQIKELETLSKLVGYHTQDKQEMEKPKSDASKKNIDNIAYRTRLVEKAHKGNLSAQLTVAHGLETGNIFSQNNAMAYFWYKRAYQNSGGEEAQSGMDRLLPHLTDVDLISIDVWTRRGHRPY